MTPCHLHHGLDRSLECLDPQARCEPRQVRGWLRRLGERLSLWARLSRERRELRELSDALLRDIGLTREQVEREARRPFWDDGGGRP